MVSRAEMLGKPQHVVNTPSDEDGPDEAEDLADPSANEVPQSSDLPEGAEEEANGVIVYTLQHPMEPRGFNKNGDPFGHDDLSKLRFRPSVYCRDIRKASAGDTRVDVVFLLACSLCDVAPHILERIDARDYSAVSKIAANLGAKGPPI